MKNKTYIAIIILVVALCGIALWLYFNSHNQPIMEGVVECKTYRASSKLAGRIDSLFVREGDWVEQGELLYTISTPELDAKLQQVAALESAAEALNMEVEHGTRKEIIRTARNMWQKASAGRDLAEKSYIRIKNLYDKGVVPRQQYDEALANFEAMKATENAAKAEYDMALDGATKEQRSAIAAKVREAQGAVDEVKSYLRDARVYAPVSGRISNIISEPGELISTGYPVVTILDLSDIWVVFNIKENDMSDITYGKYLRCYIPALDTHTMLEVTYIASEANFATWSATRAREGFDIRTFEIHARPLDNKNTLLPGMSVIINDIM